LFKRFTFSVHKAAKLWNYALLRIATVTRFSWYIAANAVVFWHCILIKNIEHMLSLKFYLN